MSFQGIKPPKDAMGREIPLDTKHMYCKDGERVEVTCFDYFPVYGEWHVRWRVGFIQEHESTSEMLLSTPDSWERLEDDIYSAVMSEYLEDPRADVRTLVARAKALAEREKR